MPVAFKNYYDVLGVAPTAGDEEIRNAFRSLARKYHPDVARNQAGAEEKFKEVNEANEVLSDPEKRRKYDELVADWNRPGRRQDPRHGGFGREPEAGPEFHFDGTGFSDFFEQFFGSRGRPAGGFGGGWEPDAAGGHPGPQRGQDIEGDILVTLEEVLRGSLRTLRLARRDPRTGQPASQTLQVKIPPGVREGQLIRLTGKGGDGIGGGGAGNLYLRVAFAKHPEFRVRGADLVHELALAPWEAVLGGTVNMPTLDGKVSLRIPPGTTAGRQFRLRGKGLPTHNGPRGDLYASVSIQVPTDIQPEEQVLWKQLAKTAAFNPRRTA
jgi:curved DNA-binding protein